MDLALAIVPKVPWGVARSGEAKFGQLQHASIHEDIGGLEVTVDDLPGADEEQRLEPLPQHRLDLRQ